MSEPRFIKFIPCEKANWLASKHPNAFILLMFIAQRARRYDGHIDGLKSGEAKIGDWENLGFSRQNYRTALKILIIYKFVEKLETNRTRKKSTTGSTTEGTLVKLLNSEIWDINSEEDNHWPNHCLTTDQPLTNHEQERTRKNKNAFCKKETNKEKVMNNESDGKILPLIRAHNSKPQTGQEIPPQNDSRNDHGTQVALAPLARPAANLPLSHKAKEEAAEALEGILGMRGLRIERSVLMRWLKDHSLDKIMDNIQHMDKAKKIPDNVGGWLHKALVEDYAKQEKFKQINREFAMQFKAQYGIRHLKINKNYCSDTESKNDYQYHLQPDVFADMLQRKYLQA